MARPSQFRPFVCVVVSFFTPAMVWTTRALDTQDSLNRYGRQSWRSDSGLPQNTVHAVLQTREGYLWFGTEGGLVRFDGVRFSVYDTQNTPGLKSNNVRSLVEDREGALWLGTTEGVARYFHSEFRMFGEEDGLPSVDIRSVACDKGGSVWAATSGGLAHFSKGHFVVEGNAHTVDSTGAFAVDPAGELWIATQRGLLAATTGESAKSVSALADGRVLALLFDSSGRTWMGGQNGLRVSGGESPAYYNVRNGLPGNRITTLFEDKEHAVWVGTDTGAARIVNGKVERFAATDALSDDAIDAIFEDREGDIWIGSESGGATVLRDQKFVTYTFRNGNTNDQIRCVFEDQSSVVWVGTNGDGLKRFAGGTFSDFSTANGLSSNVILALGQSDGGDLLVGTPDGLNRISQKRVSLLTTSDGLPEDFIRSILADKNGTFWVGTRQGLSYITDNRVTTYTQANGLGSDLVGALLRDKQGDLWAGTLHGLSRFQKGAFKNFTTADGLSSNVITDLYLDGQKNLWIATQDGGLNVLRGGTITSFPSRLGIPETIFGIAEDASGNFWLAAKTGIYRVSKSDLEAFVKKRNLTVSVISYGTSDGLLVQESNGGGHPAVWKDHSGTIWFSTANGVAALTRNHQSLNRTPPPVVLESVAVDDQVVRPTDAATIRPGHSRFAFEYAGLSFEAPQKVHYKYKLDGFDREWIDAGTRRVAYYTNLPPGSYRFHVIARNNDGIWNEGGGSLRIRIEPHFYQTWWFDLVLCLVAGLMIYAVYRWQVRQVKYRFDAVLRERNRIAREVHDTLAQGLVGVSVQLEVVSRLLGSSVDTARDHLDQARFLVRNSLSDARRSIWELRSEDGDAPDFASRLSKLARTVSESSAAKVQLQIQGTYRPLDRSVEDELYRIGQEAVTNAIRHADAQHITINLTFGARNLRMTVNDDGQGFDSQVASLGPDGHFGLKGMRERAAQIHARFDVKSIRGAGTTISVEAPAK